MAPGPRPSNGDAPIIDLGGGPRPRGGGRGRSILRPRDLVALLRRQPARAARFGGALARAGRFVLLATSLLTAAIGAWVMGAPIVALGLALLGFGLSTAALLYSRLRAIRTLAARLSPRVRWGAAAGGVGLLGLLGLFSGIVLGLVLFIGAFATVGMLWNLLSRLITPRALEGTVEEARPDLLPVVAAGGLVIVLFSLLGLPLIFLARQLGPWAPILAGGQGGLVLGLLPTDAGLVRELRRPTKALWFAFHARRVVRDCLFSAAVLALLVRAVMVAAAGGEAGLLGLALIVVSYLYILVRRLPALASFGPRPQPLLLPSFTFLLLFSPLIGLLSAAPALPMVYSGAVVLGLATGLALVLLGQTGMQWRLPLPLNRLAATYGLARHREPKRLPGGGTSSAGLEVIPLQPRERGPRR